MTTWLTAQEAAAHAKHSNTRIVLEAVKSGDLPASNGGRTGNIKDVRIKQSAVDEWLESRPWEPKAAS